MAAIVTPKLTYWDLYEMPYDGKRYQIIDGEVHVTPSPNTKHQRAVLRLCVALDNFVRERDMGEIFLAPFDVVFDDYNVLQPDLLFVRKERRSIITAANVFGAPDLAIEVFSPSTARFDREKKLQVYTRFGVQELWYADPETETVEVLKMAPEKGFALTQRASGDENIASSVLPGLSLTPHQVFS